MIWDKLPKPFFVLAPMANVTDSPFRRVIASCGKPDLFYTEFISADGLCSKGKGKLKKDLEYTQEERPLIVQFFSSKPDHIEKCCALASELGFDGVDINMGCPDRKVEKQGAGACLIKEPKLARELIRAARRGAGNLPVSVKTRLGYKEVQLDSWISELLDERPDALIIHARTRAEMSLVPARWNAISEVVQMAKGSGVKIIGNGDVTSLEEGNHIAQETGADGVMVGRGIFKNPWLFSGDKIEDKTVAERLDLLRLHLKYFSEFWGKDRHYDTMKRFFKVYVSDWDGSKELRIQLMETRKIEEAMAILDKYTV